MLQGTKKKNHQNTLLHFALKKETSRIRREFWLTVENHAFVLAQKKLSNNLTLMNNLYYI